MGNQSTAEGKWRGLSRVGGYVVCAAGFVLTLVAVYPGVMSPDSFDQWDPNCGNGKLDGTNLTGADPADTSVPADASFDGAMVSHLVSQFGPARKGGVRIYELDNEPVLWSITHRDVHP